MELRRSSLAPLLEGLCPAARAGDGEGAGHAVAGAFELPLLLLACGGGAGLLAGTDIEGGGGGGGGVRGSAELRGAVGVGVGAEVVALYA
jgi:hypothetical protein